MISYSMHMPDHPIGETQQAKAKNQPKIGYCRYLIYKGSQYTQRPLFAKPIYQGAGLVAAVAIQSFCEKGIPSSLTKMIPRKFYVLFPVSYALFCLSRYTVSCVVGNIVIRGFSILNIAPEGPNKKNLDASFTKIKKEKTKLQKIILIIKQHAKIALVEELIYRFMLQETLISLTKYCGFSNTMGARVFSSALFGLAHANQYYTQAVTAAVTSYIFESTLCEHQGVLTAIAVHFGNNVIAYTRECL